MTNPLARLFRGRDVKGAIVINGDAHGAVTLTVQHGPVPAAPDLPWRPLPDEPDISALLSWRCRLVDPPIDRANDLDRLVAWATSERGKSIRILSGPGGAGKSRLAAELAQRLRQGKGWCAGFFSLAGETTFPLGVTGTLLILDYPEERRVALRSLLHRFASLEPPSPRLRLLLLSRQSRDWWNRDLDEAGCAELCDGQRCEVGPLDAAATVKMIRRASESLAHQHGAAPPPLDEAALVAWHGQAPDLHGLPLIATAAAIHAVLDPAPTFTLGGADLLAALVRRERRRLDAAARADGWGEHAASRLHAFAVLRGGFTGAALATFAADPLTRQPFDLGLPPASQILDVARRQIWWQDGVPVPQPDLFAAELLDQILAEAPEESPHWLVAVLPDPATIDPDRLSRLAYDLTVLHGSRHNRLVERMVAAVAARSDCAQLWRGVLDTEVLGIELRPLAVAIGWAVIKVGNLSPDVEAGTLGNIANNLSEIGAYDEALTVARRVTETFEKLAKINPNAYYPALAMSINNLANFLSQIGAREDALTESLRSLKLYEDLFEGNSKYYRNFFAMALNNYAFILNDAGRCDEAVLSARRAVDLYNELFLSDGKSFRPELAMSLNNISLFLGGVGESDEAVTTARRAVNLYEGLFAENPSAFRADLAKSLINLSKGLGEIGQIGAALEKGKRAVFLYEALYEVNPDAYRLGFALSLNNLANFLGETGACCEAVTEARRSVDLYADLFSASPAAYRPGFAAGLSTLAKTLSETGAYEAAVTEARRGVALYEDLFIINPKAYCSGLALSLNNLANFLGQTGAHEAAVTEARRAVNLYEDLFAANPAAYRPGLAMSLTSFSRELRYTEGIDVAAKEAQRAVDLYEYLFSNSPDAYCSGLAKAQFNLAFLLSEARDLTSSIVAAERAVNLFQDLVVLMPTRFAGHLDHSRRLLQNLRDAASSPPA